MGIEEFEKEINKEEKKKIVVRGTEILEGPRFTTGSLSLDAECGCNSDGEAGLATGRIIGITGEESSGKSIVATKAARGFQEKFPDQGIVWIDAEGVWDSKWISVLGLDPDHENLRVLQPEYTEQAFNSVLKAVDHNIGLIIIDSLGALSPKEEMEDDMEKWTIGIQARLNRKMMRRFSAGVNDVDFELPSTLIYINHLNEKVGGGGGMPGSVPLVEPGGRALKFFPSIKIRMRKGGHYPKSVSISDEGVEPKAQELKFHVEKNKTAPPFRRGHFWFYFDTLDEYRPKGSIDQLEEAIRYARKYDIIKPIGESKSRVNLLDPNTGEVHSLNGSAAVAELLRSNEQLYGSIKREVLQKVKGDMIAHGAPVSEDEELEGKGKQQKKGTKGSKRAKGKEDSSIRGDSVEEGGHRNGSVSNSAQEHLVEVSLDEL